MKQSNLYCKNFLFACCLLLFLLLLPASKVKGEEKRHLNKNNDNKGKIAVLLDLSGKWKEWGKQEKKGIKFALEKSSLKISYFNTKGNSAETEKILKAIKSKGYKYILCFTRAEEYFSQWDLLKDFKKVIFTSTAPEFLPKDRKNFLTLWHSTEAIADKLKETALKIGRGSLTAVFEEGDIFWADLRDRLKKKRKEFSIKTVAKQEFQREFRRLFVENTFEGTGVIFVGTHSQYLLNEVAKMKNKQLFYQGGIVIYPYWSYNLWNSISGSKKEDSFWYKSHKIGIIQPANASAKFIDSFRFRFKHAPFLSTAVAFDSVRLLEIFLHKKPDEQLSNFFSAVYGNIEFDKQVSRIKSPLKYSTLLFEGDSFSSF